jgi:hypothetical protein
MKTIAALAASMLFGVVFTCTGYCAGFEKIHGDYQSDLFEDARPPVNQRYIDASTKAQLKQGKIKETEGSIGGITVEKGANVWGPIGTNVDTRGGDITIQNKGKQ